MKRKVLPLCLIAFALFFSACTLTVGNSGITLEENGKDIFSTNSQYKDSCPVIEETVLLDNDDNGITITALGVEYDTTWDMYAIKLEINNQSEQDISYSINYAKVDGFSMDAMAYGDIYKGYKDTFELGISRDEVILSSIADIKEIVFDIEVKASDTDELIATVPVDLKTEKYDTAVVPFEFDGVEVYSDNGITISAKPNSKNDINHPLTLFIKNETDRTVSFAYSDIAYNGEMVMELCSGVRLLPNSMKVFRMNLFFFDDIDIKEISKVDMKISISPISSDGFFSSSTQFETPRFTIENFQ